ncbi:helix-turn-helix transcriptional regulator [Sphingobium sp. AR-3-1]|uniref:Helix-turn-helix transcriptional regulator n=1 Tax=Sphingobium psychrophilum TaxID=2728834 RepID=A0A7X9WUX2_9SPHN|nr:metalloregulator ArsR/SmtB family transcription factor [Sphingobium psychrophilum]NML10362.1 helix-turn-helix transcriptional regulator [Sphingobium psychrophilum]
MMAWSAAAEMLCERATEVADLLKLVANEQRLLLLCRLREGEASVGELVGLCGLSQSSVSQHLGKMREGGLVQTRREATTIYYSMANPHVDALMEFLCSRFGRTEEHI